MKITPAEIDRLVSELRNPDFRGLMQHLRSAREIDRLFQQAADALEAQAAELAAVTAEYEKSLDEREAELEVSFDEGHYRAMSEHETPQRLRAERAEAALAEALKVLEEIGNGRILSALDAHETANVSDKPVAWLTNLGWIDSPSYTVSFEGDKSGCDNFPVYTRPSEQAVTEVVQVRIAEAVYHIGFIKAMNDATDEIRETADKAVAALKAAMEAGDE